jgi:hypothetical protein
MTHSIRIPLIGCLSVASRKHWKPISTSRLVGHVELARTVSLSRCCFPVSPPRDRLRDSHLPLGRFPSKEKPQFKKGCSINVAFACIGFTIVTCMSIYYRWENRRRDKVEGGRPPVGAHLEVIEKFDLAPGFRYVT